MIEEHHLETLRDRVAAAFAAGMEAFPHHTLHGREHLEELDRLALLLADWIPTDRLDKRRLQVLRLALILHDYAMVELPGPLREAELRGRLSAGKSFADVIRETHQDEIAKIFRSREWRSRLNGILVGAAPSDVLDAVEIARHHRFHPLEDAPEHLRDLCALMRLLDELEIGPRRAPMPTYLALRGRMDEISRFHWLKHICTRAVGEHRGDGTLIVEDDGRWKRLRIRIVVNACEASWACIQELVCAKLRDCLEKEGVGSILREYLGLRVQMEQAPASECPPNSFLEEPILEDLRMLAASALCSGRNPGHGAAMADVRGAAAPSPATPAAALDEALEAMESFCDRDLVHPLFPGAQQAPLEQVYVELRAVERSPGTFAAPGCEDPGKRGLHDGRGRTLREFLDGGFHRRWTLQGDPGSGKTTLLLQVGLTLAREARSALEQGARPEEIEAMPVLVPLREWQLQGPRELFAFVAEFHGLSAEAIAALRERSKAGAAVWLLDGLDEVDPEEIPAMVGRISRFARRGNLRRSRIVVTSRRFGYQRPEGFAELEILPLEPKGQRDLLRHYQVPEERIGPLLAAAGRSRSLSEMARNPFFLTLIALLDATRPTGDPPLLPSRRARFLREEEEQLLAGKPRARGIRTPLPYRIEARPVLEDLALKLLESGAGPYRAARIAELLRADPAGAELLERWPGQRGVDTFLSDVANHTGLLEPADRHRLTWRFLHRSIQEHLAARALARAEPERRRDLVGRLRGSEGRWAETFAYLAGESDDPDALLRELMKENADLALRALGAADNVAPSLLRELLRLVDGGHEWQKRREVIESIPERLGHTEAALCLLERIREATTHGADLFFISRMFREIGARARESGDEATARLAAEMDARLFAHVPAPPEGFLENVVLRGREQPYWCSIPEGRHVIGSPLGEEGRFDYEPLPRDITLGIYRMGAVPVTNALYEMFDRMHRSERAFRDRVRDAAELDDHPVVNVTWFEAVTFCRWATGVLRSRGCLEADEIVRLPSEAEWEAACRAGSRHRFWNGDDEEHLDAVGWYRDNSPHISHPVGEKPGNPWGLHDVHGNVEEWCADAWTDPYGGGVNDPFCPSKDPSSRLVVRGGSWFSDADGCRAAYRGVRRPVNRSRFLGFRVACGPRPQGWDSDIALAR
jgi:formylglycine-generating enzyme required for sulfatase activity